MTQHALNPGRATTLLLGLGLAALSVLSVTVWHREAWVHTVDSALYLLTAKSLAAGEGYTYLGRPFFVRPPALSACLAWLGLGTPPWRWGALNLFVDLSAVAAMWSVAWALVRLHGLRLGLGVALAAALCPLEVGALNKLFAELPFMALFYAGAALLLRRRVPAPAGVTTDVVPPLGADPGLGSTLAGALLVAASLSFRSVGILLVPCLVLVDLARRRGRPGRLCLAAALIVLCALPWFVYGSRAADLAERPSTQLLMFDYGTAMFHVDPRDPDSALVDLAGWGERLAANATELARYVTYGLTARSFGGNVPLEPWHAVVGALAGLALLLTAALRRTVLDLYAVVYAGLLLTYFTAADRLVLPLMPLVLSSMAWCLVRLAAGLRHLVRGVDWEPAVLTLAGLAYAAAVVPAIEPALGVDALRATWHADDLHTAAWVEANLPPDAVLMHEKGAIMSVLTGHTTYTFRNLPGDWPTGAPRVDFAIFSPRPKREEAEFLVRAVAGEPRYVPFDWMGQPSSMRIYDLRSFDPAEHQGEAITPLSDAVMDSLDARATQSAAHDAGRPRRDRKADR